MVDQPRPEQLRPDHPPVDGPGPGPDPTPEPRTAVVKEREFLGTGLFWSLLLGILLAIAIVIFIFQNTDSVPIEYLGWDFTAPLVGIVLAAGLAGVVLDELLGLLLRRRRRRILQEREELRRLKRR